VSEFLVGLDIGQAHDYTALVVVEKRTEEPTEAEGKPRRLYEVRYIQRFKLKTPYPDIVQQVGRLMQRDPLNAKVPLLVDETGVGKAVTDMFQPLKLRLTPITITSGFEAVRAGAGWHVPKRDLVSAVQVTLQTQRLKFARGLREVDSLIKELLDFQVKISDSGRDTYGAWREGTWDDLVLAVAMAVWHGEKGGGVMPYASAGPARPRW
jgi:hypothetical protein